MRCTQLALILALVLLSGAPSGRPGASSAGEVTAEPVFSGEIRIGATLPRTGLLEDYGLSAYYGVNTCVRQINENGGINGKRLVVIWRDNRSDPEQARRDVVEFVEKYQVPAVIGPLMSDALIAVRPAASELGVVVMSPMATIDAATVGNPWVFRATFTNSAEARSIIRFQMEKYGAKSCGILFDSRASFSVEMVDVFRKMFMENGGEVVGTHSLINDRGEVDCQAPLKDFAGKNPDFVFVACYAREATEVIRAARDLRVSLRFCGHYTWDNEVVFEGSGTRLAGTSFASALFEEGYSRQVRNFFAAMRNAGMETPDASAACAFDAVAMIAQALKTGETAEDVRKGVLGIRRLMLATGRVSVTPQGETLKPVLIRIVERRGWHMAPIYAERYDP